VLCLALKLFFCVAIVCVDTGLFCLFKSVPFSEVVLGIQKYFVGVVLEAYAHWLWQKIGKQKIVTAGV